MNSQNAVPADFWHELKAIEAESMGWQPLGRGVYLHRGAQAGAEPDMTIEVVGIADTSMAGANVLWLV